MEKLELAKIWIDVVPPIRSGQHKKMVKMGARWGMVQNAGYEKAMGGLVQVLYSARPDGWKPLDCPISVSLWLYLPHLKTTPKRDRAKILPLDVTPDWDNIAKLYGDALTRAGWVVDDKIITIGQIAKRRSPNPGIGLVIEDDTGARDPLLFAAKALGMYPQTAWRHDPAAGGAESPSGALERLLSEAGAVVVKENDDAAK